MKQGNQQGGLEEEVVVEDKFEGFGLFGKPKYFLLVRHASDVATIEVPHRQYENAIVGDTAGMIDFSGGYMARDLPKFERGLLGN